MKPTPPATPPRQTRRWRRIALTLLAVSAGALCSGIYAIRSGQSDHAATSSPGNTMVGAAPTPTLSSTNRPTPTQLNVQPETTAHRWMIADGLATNVIRKLARNDLEYQRLLEENARIQRRQLVQRKTTAATEIQQARLSGKPIRQLLLPGLDGRELTVEITRTDLNASGQQGSFTGHLADQPDSMVTLAFKGGREAFTVLAPAEKLYLQADPYEPGQVLVKQIDPATYVLGVCGTPD